MDQVTAHGSWQAACRRCKKPYSPLPWFLEMRVECMSSPITPHTVCGLHQVAAHVWCHMLVLLGPTCIQPSERGSTAPLSTYIRPLTTNASLPAPSKPHMPTHPESQPYGLSASPQQQAGLCQMPKAMCAARCVWHRQGHSMTAEQGPTGHEAWPHETADAVIHR
jgi:hypothetical protein